jgi:hypothetical protein
LEAFQQLQEMVAVAVEVDHLDLLEHQPQEAVLEDLQMEAVVVLVLRVWDSLLDMLQETAPQKLLVAADQLKMVAVAVAEESNFLAKALDLEHLVVQAVQEKL